LSADFHQCTHGLIFAAVGLPSEIGLPRGSPRSLFVWKIARLLFNSFRKDIERPLAESLAVDRHGGTLLSFVAHTAEHTLSSDRNGQRYSPDPTPGTPNHR